MGWIGAGSFAQAYLIPEFQKRSGVFLDTVCNSTTASAYDACRKFHFAQATCNPAEILDAADLNCIAITTRHDLHAKLAVEALRGNKHVFLEKPIALTPEDLQRVLSAARESRGTIVVGFNRRYAPLVTWLREQFKPHNEALMIQYRVNAGPVPAGHWVRDSIEGGGRIIGEVCHFVDLCHYLAGAPPVSVFCQASPGLAGVESEHDNVQLQVRFANGSLAQVSYTAVADPEFPRERLEVVGQGAIGVIDNFRTALVSRKGKRWNKRLWARDMGYGEEVGQFVGALLEGRSMPVAFEESALSMLATLLAVESLRTGQPIQLDPNAVSSEESLLP
jgi:polar amino acid transport system substrate-binding protein